VRHITLPSRRRVLVSDTVGFIRNLPTTLVKAFRATLEEVTEANLLLHVVDAGSPEAPEHTAHVLATLQEIGAESTLQILVLNKIDQVAGEPDASALARRILQDPEHQPAGAVAISARTGAGFEALLRKIDDTLALDPVIECRFRIPVSEGGPVHLLHQYARVTSTRYSDDFCEIEAVVPESIRRRLSKYLVAPDRIS
jgi:GTP-binding protein HflX